jgi:hypothetical protein
MFTKYVSSKLGVAYIVGAIHESIRRFQNVEIIKMVMIHILGFAQYQIIEIIRRTMLFTVIRTL